MFSSVLFGPAGFYSKLPFKWSSFLLSSSLSASSFYQDRRRNEGKLERSKVCCLNEWRRRGAGWMRSLVPVWLAAKAPGCLLKKASSIHPVSSLVKGGIKQRQRGKVIFFAWLSILSVGFFHFFPWTFINLIIIFPRAPREWMGSLYLFLSSPLLFLGRRKSY